MRQWLISLILQSFRYAIWYMYQACQLLMNRIKTETIRVNHTLVPVAEREILLAGYLPIVSVMFPAHNAYQVYYDIAQ